MRVVVRNLVVIGSSSLIQAAAVFVKGVILARILSVHEFGLAVIIIAITGALDIFADAGIDRFVVQNRFGYRRDLVNTSHTFRVFGSLVVGMAIAMVSFPLALLFNAPELWGPIAATGGVIAIRGFINLGFKLQQRVHRFEKETIIDTARFTFDLAVTTACGLAFHSYLAVLAGAYTNAIIQVALSHILSNFAYSCLPRRKLLRLVGRFSVPIYINATMLFAAMQGDRMVVAGMYTKKQVALYAVACTLGQGVTTLIGKVSERLLLPMFTPKVSPLNERRLKVSRIGALFIAGATVFQLSVTLLGPLFTKLIYGKAYNNLNGIIYAAAIFQMIQIQQSWVNSVLMANGLTAPFPKITLMRSAAFPAAVVFALLGMGLISIPIAFALGASLSLCVSYYSARKLRLIDPRIIVGSLAIIAVSILTVVYLAYIRLI